MPRLYVGIVVQKVGTLIRLRRLGILRFAQNDSTQAFSRLKGFFDSLSPAAAGETSLRMTARNIFGEVETRHAASLCADSR